MNEVIDQLLAIEQDYYAGMGFQTLSKRIVKVSATIASLDEKDPAQQACRTFAPMLWEATSGASVNPSARMMDRLVAGDATTQTPLQTVGIRYDEGKWTGYSATGGRHDDRRDRRTPQ